MEYKTAYVGDKLTESISARLDPKTRYLLELACRADRRSISNTIEIAIHNLIQNIELQERIEKKGDSAKTLSDMADILWEGNSLERLCKLGIFYPYLLSAQEKDIWDEIVRNGLVPDSHYKANVSREKVWIEMRDTYMVFIELHNQIIIRRAHGGHDELPAFTETK